MHSISDTNVHRSLVNVDNEKLWSGGGFFCWHKKRKSRGEYNVGMWCDITQTLSALSAENGDNDDEDAMIINQHQGESIRMSMMMMRRMNEGIIRNNLHPSQFQIIIRHVVYEMPFTFMWIHAEHRIIFYYNNKLCAKMYSMGKILNNERIWMWVKSRCMVELHSSYLRPHQEQHCINIKLNFQSAKNWNERKQKVENSKSSREFIHSVIQLSLYSSSCYNHLYWFLLCPPHLAERHTAYN